MRRPVTKLREEGEPAFRPDSYEASLTEQERELLYAALLSGKTLKRVQAGSVAWRGGPDGGKQPSMPTLQGIRSRLRFDRTLEEVSGTVEVIEGARAALGPLVEGTAAEEVLDIVMALIAKDVIDKTLGKMDPAARTAAARLLLKRADQRRVDRHLKILEARTAKEKPSRRARKATVKEKTAKVNQIFGM